MEVFSRSEVKVSERMRHLRSAQPNARLIYGN
jgi:hypothetical protein